jgi:hypothetical protein
MSPASWMARRIARTAPRQRPPRIASAARGGPPIHTEPGYIVAQTLPAHPNGAQLRTVGEYWHKPPMQAPVYTVSKPIVPICWHD